MFVFPYEKVKQGQKIIIWGAGNVGRDYYTQIVQSHCCEILGVIDSACKYESGVFKTEEILKSDFDYVVIAVENEAASIEIRNELLKMMVSASKIIWDIHKSIDKSSFTEQDLIGGKWLDVYEEYEKYALGNFGFFNDLMQMIKRSEKKKKLIDSVKKERWRSEKQRVVMLRVLLLSDCFDAELMRQYMNVMTDIQNPELAVCLLYEIVWKELVHSEYRYPEYYNERREVIKNNTARLMRDFNSTKFPQKETNEEIKKICYLRLNFPAYKRSNATRRNLAIANELAARGYEVEEIFVDLLEDCNVRGLINFTGNFDIPADNAQYVHEKLRLYFSKGNGIKERMEDVLNEIARFNPDLIIDSCADYEMLSSILINHYRIIQIPCRSTNSCTYMDKCIVSSEEIFENDWGIFHSQEHGKVCFKNKYLREKLNVENIICGMERKKYGIEEDRFVIVTIGTRIGMELSVEMVDAISNKLYRYPDIVWILAGDGDLSWICEQYEDLVRKKQIIIWGYENRVDDFWKRLDVKLFISPAVTGNGGCAYRALYSGVPVLINKSINGDIATIIGYKNMIDGGYSELSDRVEHFYLNRETLEKASSDARKLIAELPTVGQYVDFIIDRAREI